MNAMSLGTSGCCQMNDWPGRVRMYSSRAASNAPEAIGVELLLQARPVVGGPVVQQALTHGLGQHVRRRECGGNERGGGPFHGSSDGAGVTEAVGFAKLTAAGSPGSPQRASNAEEVSRFERLELETSGKRTWGHERNPSTWRRDDCRRARPRPATGNPAEMRKEFRFAARPGVLRPARHSRGSWMRDVGGLGDTWARARETRARRLAPWSQPPVPSSISKTAPPQGVPTRVVARRRPRRRRTRTTIPSSANSRDDGRARQRARELNDARPARTGAGLKRAPRRAPQNPARHEARPTPASAPRPPRPPRPATAAEAGARLRRLVAAAAPAAVGGVAASAVRAAGGVRRRPRRALIVFAIHGFSRKASAAVMPARRSHAR
jgi:hypothetical protein